MFGTLRKLLSGEPERPLRARAPRVAVAARSFVTIDRKPYPLKNWSLSGVLFGPYDGDLIVRQRFRMTVAVKDAVNDIEFDTDAVVVRRMGSDLAAQFFQLHPAYRARIEKYFSSYGQQAPR
ncbi:MAG: hypothetical protein OHK0024_14410 [Thalassobaculales bacterium]